MSIGFVAAVSLILLLVLIFSGIHLSTSLMITSVIGVYLSTGRIATAMNVLAQSAWGAVRSYNVWRYPVVCSDGVVCQYVRCQQGSV